MAWHSELHDEKQHTGDLQLSHSRGRVLGVSSSRDKVEELWSMIRYDILLDSSIPGDLRRRGVRTQTQLAHILSELSAYLDQAENFYRYASASDYRSAPLLYYYAFLNLAKAYIVLQRPNMVDKKFVHSIKRKRSNGNLANRSFFAESSRGNRVSVFNELYNLTYGQYLPVGRAISFENTLGYMTDITNETVNLLNRPSKKAHLARLYVFLNKNTQKCWTVLATEQGFYPANYKAAFDTFASKFQRFNPGPLTLEYSIRMSEPQAKNYSFSQSVAEYDVLPSGSIATWETKTHIEDALGNFYQDHAYDGEASFVITDPLRKNWQIPFNEMLAIYSLMFCLSEVVRYTPGEFNTNFAADTKEGWLIKSFVGSTPYACLVHLASGITGKTYIIKGR